MKLEAIEPAEPSFRLELTASEALALYLSIDANAAERLAPDTRISGVDARENAQDIEEALYDTLRGAGWLEG